VEAIRAQLASPEPRVGAVRAAAKAIKAVLDGLTATGKAAREAVPLLERARAPLARLRS
jgi:hypothetical protein